MSPVTRSNKAATEAAKEAATLLEDAAQRVGHLLKTQGPNSIEKNPTERPTEKPTENPTEIPYTKKKSKNG